MTYIDLFVLEKEVNSTQRPEGEGLRQMCDLNTPCDVMEPVFIFEANENVEWLSYNYLYWDEADRYYWIDKWVWTNGMWHAHCHIDPLASWYRGDG